MNNFKIFIDRNGKEHIKPDDVKVKRRYSVYGMAIINNRILMVKPTWNEKWELPGGQVEKSESDDKALYREYKEETGYLIEEMDKNQIAEMENNFYLEDSRDTYYHAHLKFFALTSIVKMSEFRQRTHEIQAVEWIDIFSLNKKNCNPMYLKVIRDFIKKLVD